MTFWDFLYKLIDKSNLAWALFVLMLVAVVWLIAHPQVVKEWNVQITMWIAAIAPKKRKKAFAKRLNLTIDSTKTKFDESAPPLMKKFLPYDLKVEWVTEGESPDSFYDNNQVVVYVHSYKDEAQQVVGILHDYCAKGLVQKAKLYMPSSVSKSSDIAVKTGRLEIEVCAPENLLTNVFAVIYADTNMSKDLEVSREPISAVTNGNVETFSFNIDNPNLMYSYCIEWEFNEQI